MPEQRGFDELNIAERFDALAATALEEITTLPTDLISERIDEFPPETKEEVAAQVASLLKCRRQRLQRVPLEPKSETYSRLNVDPMVIHEGIARVALLKLSPFPFDK